MHWLVLGYTATPEVCKNSNVLCLSMCLSSSCSKSLSGCSLRLLVGSGVLAECHVGANGGLGDR